MNTERESHVVPAIVAVVGVVAFAVLVYLFFAGADWLLNRLFGGGIGTPF
jgi:preprotein translocase subunit SecE